jgi:hypothetical protein
VNYQGLLLAYAARGPEELLRVGQALMYAAPEQQQRIDYPQFSGADLPSHIAFLERRGYEVSEVERTELARYRRPPATNDDSDQAAAEDDQAAAKGDPGDGERDAASAEE